MKNIGKKMLCAFLVMACLTSMVFAQGTTENAPATAGATPPYDIAVIIKATDSDFWQYLLVGAQNYQVDHPDLVKITTYGPPSEADIDKQVTILENVIATNPDAIVISSTSSDATVPALEDAHDKGIKIITVDNKVNTDKVDSFLATNNIQGGALAADKMAENFKAFGVDPNGKKAVVVNAMAGVQVLNDREKGFTDRLKELYPNIQMVETRFVDNDIAKAMNATEDLITTYGDELVAIFAANNHTGDGVARAINERGLGNKIICTAFDSDPEEIEGIKNGSLKAIMLQDPYGMGYKGVDYAVKALQGESLPEYVDTGVNAVDKTNIDNPDVQGLLNPITLKKY